MTNRYVTETFGANMELGDGSYLEMQITYFVNRRLYDTEDVVDPEPVFRLNGKSVFREELPSEITDEVLEKLMRGDEEE